MYLALQWRTELAVGVKQIDEQHQELFARIDSLLSACSQGKGRDEVAQVIDFLGDYVVKHFADEEALQMKVGYPGYTAHRAMHQQFIADYSQLAQQLHSEGASVRFVLRVNRTVVDWLVQHISKVDKELATYVKAGNH